MKKMRLGLIAIIALSLCSCAQSPGSASAPPYAARSEGEPQAGAFHSSPAECLTESEESGLLQATKAAEAPGAENLPEPSPQVPEASFSLGDVEPYSGQPYTVVGDNVPFFSEEELVADSFESYSKLDELGRCGPAYACVGLDLMPTQERGEIGNVRPTGWHTVKYNGIIDGNYLYNRCHLIGYALSGENANERNLITGTRYLNVQGMLPFESRVAEYVTETGNHVLYRVTPVFEGENLLASGALMEAESVEDRGEGVSFCVYVYNVQPGIAIDYATGESAIAPDVQVPDSIEAPSQEPSSESFADSSPEPDTEHSQEEPPQGKTYILNTNTKKFHYPSCSSVKQMKEKNRQDYTGSRDDVISMGYDPCKNCNP